MKKINFLLLFLVFFHLAILSLLCFIAWPEMILWPYLLLNSWLPYKDIAMAHNPLLIFDLAIFYKFFGVSLLSLKIYTWILILITDLLVFLIAKSLTRNEKIALFSLLFYIIWQPFFEGNGIWFDLVLAPIGLLIFYSFLIKKNFGAGLLFGLAILVKQTALWFIFPILITFLILKTINIKALLKFLVGLIIPVLVFVIYLFITKTFWDFYFWAVKFGIFYLPRASGQIELPTIKQLLQVFIIFLPAIGLLCTLLLQSNKVEKLKPLILILLFWFGFSTLGIYPRWSLFHFQPALPFLAIIFGILISFVNFSDKKFFNGWIWFLLIVLISGTIYLQVRFYKLNWQKEERFFEKETLQMAAWLKENTKKGEKIFILNSWDHLYALSNTLPAVRPWVPTLPWYLEYPGIQEKLVENLKREEPKLIIFEPYKKEGLGSYKPEIIDKFLQENYTLEKIIAERFWLLKIKG